MKRKLIALAMMLAVLLMFAGCGAQENNEKPTGENLPAQQPSGVGSRDDAAVQAEYDAMRRPDIIWDGNIYEMSQDEIIAMMKSPDYQKMIDALAGEYFLDGITEDSEADLSQFTTTSEFLFGEERSGETGVGFSEWVTDFDYSQIEDVDVPDEKPESGSGQGEVVIGSSPEEFDYLKNISGVTLYNASVIDGDSMFTYFGSEADAKNIVSVLQEHGFTVNAEETAVSGMYLYEADSAENLHVALTHMNGSIIVVIGGN